jgi:amino acid adenylation domain-containing protein
MHQTEIARSTRTLWEAFAAWAERAPDAEAVRCGDARLSYAELRDRAEAVAEALAERGVGPGTLIGVALDRSVDLVAALMGVLRSGAAYVPIDPSFPADRVGMMLEDSGSPVVVTSYAHRRLATAADAEPLLMEAVPACPRAEVRACAARAEDLAYVIYTSGSTGRPKGVMIEHRGLNNLLASVVEQLRSRPGDRLLSVTTVSFDIHTLEVFVPLVSGGCVVVATREDTLDGRKLARLLESEGVSVFQATPATWRLLLDGGWAGDRSLKGLIGGEALPAQLARDLLTRVGELWNMYGPTETSVWSTCHLVESAEAAPPIGRAMRKTTLAIVDESGNPVAPGEIGELLIGGEGVARGYHNRPDLTAERFIGAERYGGGPGERVYRTGDLCRMRDDGVVEYHGRADHQVKIRGYRIELGDIESTLSTHPAVRECVVGPRGEDEAKHLVAYVTLKDGRTATAAELREHIGAKLPAYMVPSAAAFLDEMPLTPNRKIDRKALAALPLGASGGSDRLDEPVVLEGAVDDLDTLLLRIFSKMLGRARISVDDDFFEIGGHSLLAFQTALEIERETGQNVEVATIFEHPRVRDLSGALRSAGGIRKATTSVKLQPLGDGPPLFCIAGVAVYMPLARAIGTDFPTYGMYIDTEFELFHGKEQSERDFLTFEEMADRYLAEIRARQPHGPYRIGGLSMAGAVALEVARKLQELGEPVELVVMFDTILPSSVRKRPWDWARHKARAVARRGIGRVLEKLRRGAAAAPEPEPATIGDPAPADTARTSRVERRGGRQLALYHPRPYVGDVLLLNAMDRERLPYCDYDETGGWGALVLGRLTIEHVPGSHLGLLTEPNVRSVARAIRAAIRPQTGGVLRLSERSVGGA